MEFRLGMASDGTIVLLAWGERGKALATTHSQSELAFSRATELKARPSSPWKLRLAYGGAFTFFGTVLPVSAYELIWKPYWQTSAILFVF
jgi:hypothetical protein